MSQLADEIKSGGHNLKWLGILTVWLGLLACFTPLMTGISVVVLVGFFVVAGGIARMFWAFKTGSFGKGLFLFALGGLTLICGLLMVTDPLLASGILTVMIAIYLLVDGGFEIAAAFNASPEFSRGWMIFNGIISILLGIMIWRQFPVSGAWALGLFLGIKLLFIGLTMLGVGRFMEKRA